jgi:hypothetical protein
MCAAKGKPAEKIVSQQTLTGKPLIFAHQSSPVNRTSSESARDSTILRLPEQ